MTVIRAISKHDMGRTPAGSHWLESDLFGIAPERFSMPRGLTINGQMTNYGRRRASTILGQVSSKKAHYAWRNASPKVDEPA
jgi:hypothetical protein